MHSLLLEFKNTANVGAAEFKAINWLPTKDRFDQHTCVSIKKFSKEQNIPANGPKPGDTKV